MSDRYEPANLQVFDTVDDMVRAFPQPLVHYEGNGAILLKNCGFAFDDAFIANATFPPEWKKIGTINGLTNTPIAFREGAFVRNDNPLCKLIADDRLLLKVFSELLRLELSFKLLVATVFSAYRKINWINCTFRFTPTRDEDVHLDAFNNGAPFPPEWHQPRLKLFLNVDREPRVWNVGPTLPNVLKHARAHLPPRLPADVNVLNNIINQSGALAHCPVTRVEIPPRGVIFANGSTVVHQVVYGNRTVGLEGLMPSSLMYSQCGSEWDHMRSWLAAAGYACE